MAHFWTLKAFLPDMINKKLGHIVNVASLSGHSGTNKLVDYCASKFAAVGLDESLRVELAVQVYWNNLYFPLPIPSFTLKYFELVLVLVICRM